MSNKRPSFIAALLILGGVVVSQTCCSQMAGGDMLIGFPHDVQGEIVKDPGQRYQRSESGGQEKISLTISVPANEIAPTLEAGYAHSSGQLTVECISTRCSQIVKGELHAFVCRAEGRFTEPNVVVCKHSKAL